MPPSPADPLVPRLRRAAVPIALWLVAGIGLSQITGRVTDWYLMTDELVWERLALSAARTGSLAPRVHGASVSNLDQLYPWLIAPLFRTSSVLHDLHQAHLLGAWVMSSACIPAYLLARRVTGRPGVALLAAVLSIALPWTIYSAMVLTEVVAYPAFLWAMLALQRATVRPSPRTDLLLVAALALVFLARTQFVCLVPVPPLVFVGWALGDAAGPAPRRLAAAIRGATRDHRLLAVVYGAGVVAAAAFAATGGKLLGLSNEGQQVTGGIVPPGFTSAFLGTLAQLAFGVAVLPFVVGTGLMLARIARRPADAELRAFAWIGLATTLAITAVVARFDLNAAAGATFDRYLFYLVPIVVIAFLSALREPRVPLWSLAVPVLAVCTGFVVRFQAPFTWSDPGGPPDGNSPISIFYKPIVDAAGSERGAQVVLVAGSLLLTALFAVAMRFPRHRTHVAVLLTALVGLGLPLEAGVVFARLLGTTGNSSRPLTGNATRAAGLDWVDRAVGSQADVTMIPYSVSTDYFVNLRYWRDLEFWNKSVDRNAEYPSTSQYSFTGIWFPKLTLAFNPATGSSPLSPTRYAVQSVTESRFRIAGPVRVQTPEALLIDAPRPWRLAWLTLGATDDGWLHPRVPARVRLFAPSQTRGARTYYLSLQIGAPPGVRGRSFTVTSNVGRFSGTVTDGSSAVVTSLPVCVPPGRFSDVTVRAPGDSPIPGDLSSLAASTLPRRGSILFRDISVSDDVGPACSARS